MKQISIPYETQNGKLTMQTLNWPQRCACCGGEDASQRLQIDHRAELREIATNKVSFYPLAWGVPYCPTCYQHARTIPMLKLGIFVAGGLLWVGFGYLLFLWGLAEETMGMVIFLASLVLIGWGCFQLIKFAKDKFIDMTPNCVQENAAVEVASMNQQITFSFHHDQYAADFAALNQV